MIPVDLHSHSLFSGCGVHTVLEMLTAAKTSGMKGIAITDHGKLVGGRANSVFFERLHDPVPGIRLLKGMECNVDSDTGKIDCPMKFLGFMDIVIAGLHDNLPSGLSRDNHTAMLIKAMEQNLFLDMVSHPNNNLYPVHYQPVVEAAVRLGIVLEMNNSKVLMRRVPDQETEELILLCKRLRCRVAVVSDSHVVTEVGRDDEIRPLLSKHQFPEELIVNRTAEAAFAFIEERRERKTP